MQELLFQNGLITWTDSGIPSFWISVSLFVVMLAIYLSRKIPKKPVIHIPEPYTMIAPDDRDYIVRTITAIKEYLLERSLPHHVTAHTADEIAAYIDNPALRDIIHELEHIEYSGKVLSIVEKTEYNERIEKVLGIRT